jgi:uncharacterized integral membrane protein
MPPIEQASKQLDQPEGVTMTEQSPDDGPKRSRLSGGAITSISGGALLIIFMIQNTEEITLHFLV